MVDVDDSVWGVCKAIFCRQVAINSFLSFVYFDYIFCFCSKEESGFMAVPLVSRGVAVVAVDYTIAPKGALSPHLSHNGIIMAKCLKVVCLFVFYQGAH